MSNSSEHEWESESEGEFEALPEGEAQNEWEGEGASHSQGESEAEGEAFFQQLVQLAKRASRSPALQKIAGDAARAALKAAQASLESESEFESEQFDGESDLESQILDEMMEQLGLNAANAQSESEAAEAFLPLIPMLAAKLLPMAAKAIPLASKVAPKLISTVMKSAPQMNKAIKGLTKTLYRKPGGKQLIRTVPTIARRTAMSMAKQIAQGRPVTPQTAVRTFAGQANKVLSNPKQTVQALARSRKLTPRMQGCAGGATRSAQSPKAQSCACGGNG